MHYLFYNFKFIILFFFSNFKNNNIKKNYNYFTKCNYTTNNWNINKKNILNIKKFKVNGIITYKNGFKKIFLNFYLDNIYYKSFIFKAYTFFGIKLIDFIYNIDNSKSDKKHNNVQLLFEKISNTNIPIKNLGLWIIGLPCSNDKYILNNKGYIKEIYYIDKFKKKYKIVYYKYNKNIYPNLPEIIEFHQGNNKVNLKIKNWNLIN